MLTVGPFSCGVGPIDVEVHDVVDPNCFVVVSAFPPTTECGGSTCALTVSQLEYFNCTNDDISYCAVIVVEDGGTGSPNGWVTSNDLAGEYGEPTTIELLCANAPDLLVIEDAEDPNCSFTIELDTPANICSSSCGRYFGMLRRRPILLGNHFLFWSRRSCATDTRCSVFRR